MLFKTAHADEKCDAILLRTPITTLKFPTTSQPSLSMLQSQSGYPIPSRSRHRIFDRVVGTIEAKLNQVATHFQTEFEIGTPGLSS
jgi:hypothetical protein